jgi:hypothetical protein
MWVGAGLFACGVAALIASASTTGALKGAGDRVDLAMAGVDPTASPWATAHQDFAYAQSPLQAALELEALLGPTSAPPVLAFADDLSRHMGLWLLRHTGASSIEDAETALWAAGPPDAFVVELARQLRDRQVYLRRNKRLGADGVATPPIYMHPDEVVWVAAHVAWRLDLNMVLVHSPAHQFLRWDEPGGTGSRTVEITCFRRVDGTGKGVPSEEFSVGRRLTGPADHYPSGAGGIHASLGNDYHDIGPASLVPELIGRMLLWRDHTSAATASELLGSRPEEEVAALWFSIHIHEGLAALADGDRRGLKQAAEQALRLRAEWPAALPTAPDEQVLAVAANLQGASLRGVFDAYEPNGPVERPVNAAHTAAMWLDLQSGRPALEAFNARVVPLMNVTSDPAKVSQLCTYGRQALQDAKQSVEELLPPCATP